LAVTPPAYSILRGEDSIGIAMAVTAMAGLAFATFLSLLVVPVLDTTFLNIRQPVER
jgi:multidrug efflux pump subunit AcrB